MNFYEIKKQLIPVLKKHNVKRAGIFGSFATQKNHGDSDLDILIDLENEISLLDFIGIKLDLEDLLGFDVDLVEYHAIRPELKKRILNEELRLYG